MRSTRTASSLWTLPNKRHDGGHVTDEELGWTRRGREPCWTKASSPCPVQVPAAARPAGIRLEAVRPHLQRARWLAGSDGRIEHMFGTRNVGTEAAVRTCSIEGCGRKYVARGYCGMHYQRWLTTGQLGPADLVNKPAKGLVCQADRCCKDAKAKGFCATHYWRWRAHGQPGAAATVTRKRKGIPREVAGCRRLADGDGLCRIHYERRHRGGRPRWPQRAESSARGRESHPSRLAGYHGQWAAGSGTPPCGWSNTLADHSARARPYVTVRPLAEHHRQPRALDWRAAVRPARRRPAGVS